MQLKLVALAQHVAMRDSLQSMLANLATIRVSLDVRMTAFVADLRRRYTCGERLRATPLWDVVAFVAAVYAVEQLTLQVSRMGQAVWQIERACHTAEWLWRHGQKRRPGSAKAKQG